MSGTVLVATLVCVLAIQRVVELRLARRNEARARARGAIEFGASHYRLFFLLHGAWLVAWPSEALLRGGALPPAWPLWLGGFVAAQLLRYWAIASLGERWNTRVLVVPGDTPLRRGPYRWLAHPNYLAVVIELAVVPLCVGAPITAAVASLANAALLGLVRIPFERRALTHAASDRGAAAP
jgi:methyltransferase